MLPFKEFPKMPRLSREIVITEKIDGTNGGINLLPIELEEFPTDPNIVFTMSGLNVRVASRNKWITPGKSNDNAGFAGWVLQNAEEIVKLGEGHHFGEWWGKGIQRGYGLNEKRFSLFNVSRWDSEDRPACCHVVPTLFRGNFNTLQVDYTLAELATNGSSAAPGFMKPEGIIIWHTAGNFGFKKTIEKDETPKSLVK